MNRVLAGTMVIIASIAGFMMVASQPNVPEGVMLFTGIAMLALGIGGLALLLSDGEVGGGRTSNHHTEVHVHGQGQPAWMERQPVSYQPPAPPQVVFMPMPAPQYPPQTPGMTPEQVMHLVGKQMEAYLGQHAKATQAAIAEHARYTGQLTAPAQYMGYLPQAPDGRYIDVEHRKALPAPRGPSLATQGLRLLFKGKAR